MHMTCTYNKIQAFPIVLTSQRGFWHRNCKAYYSHNVSQYNLYVVLYFCFFDRRTMQQDYGLRYIPVSAKIIIKTGRSFWNLVGYFKSSGVGEICRSVVIWSPESDVNPRCEWSHSRTRLSDWNSGLQFVWIELSRMHDCTLSRLRSLSVLYWLYYAENVLYKSELQMPRAGIKCPALGEL